MSLRLNLATGHAPIINSESFKEIYSIRVFWTLGCKNFLVSRNDLKFNFSELPLPVGHSLQLGIFTDEVLTFLDLSKLLDSLDSELFGALPSSIGGSLEKFLRETYTKGRLIQTGRLTLNPEEPFDSTDLGILSGPPLKRRKTTASQRPPSTAGSSVEEQSVQQSSEAAVDSSTEVPRRSQTCGQRVVAHCTIL